MSSEIGKRLREERERVGIALDEIANYTKIPKRYLEALENNALQLLPSPAHTKAYIRKYADLLGLPSRQLLDLYKAEHYVEEKTTPKQRISVFKQLSGRTFVLTTSQTIIIIAAIISFLFLFYIYLQLRTLLAPPALTLVKPADGALITDTNVTVQGQTVPDAELFINDRKVVVESDGFFQEQISLSTDTIQNVVVTAINKVSKKKKQLRRTIKVDIPSVHDIFEQQTASTAEASMLKTVIRVTQDTWFRVKIDDDNEGKDFILARNTSKEYEAHQQIVIRSGKPYATYLTFDDGEERVMSTKRFPLEKTWKK